MSGGEGICCWCDNKGYTDGTGDNHPCCWCGSTSHHVQSIEEYQNSKEEEERYLILAVGTSPGGKN